MISGEIEVCFGSDNLSLVVPSLPNLFSFKDTATRKGNLVVYVMDGILKTWRGGGGGGGRCVCVCVNPPAQIYRSFFKQV